MGCRGSSAKWMEDGERGGWLGRGGGCYVGKVEVMGGRVREFWEWERVQDRDGNAYFPAYSASHFPDNFFAFFLLSLLLALLLLFLFTIIMLLEPLLVLLFTIIHYAAGATACVAVHHHP